MCRSGTPIALGLKKKGCSTVGTNQCHTYVVPVSDIPHTTCLHCFTDHRQVMTYEVWLGYLRCCCDWRCQSTEGLRSSGFLRLRCLIRY